MIDKGYKLFSFMQYRYSSDAGLVPDFIVHINKTAKPAPRHYLESHTMVTTTTMPAAFLAYRD